MRGRGNPRGHGGDCLGDQEVTHHGVVTIRRETEEVKKSDAWVVFVMLLFLGLVIVTCRGYPG